MAQSWRAAIKCEISALNWTDAAELSDRGEGGEEMKNLTHFDTMCPLLSVKQTFSAGIRMARAFRTVDLKSSDKTAC